MESGINPKFLMNMLKNIKKAFSQPARFEKGTSLQEQQQFQKPRPKYNFSTQKSNQQPKPQIDPNILLNRPQQAAMMKEMLQLPKDLRAFLAQLMAENQKLDPEVLKQFLESNSKDVISKLIRLIQQSPQSQQNHEQLKQLISLLSQVTPKGDTPQQEVITQMILLYLPWLPLMEQQKIEIHFEKRQEEEDAPVDDSVAMVLYVSTINYGRFKIVIFIDKLQHLEIVIQNTEAEEKDALKTILKAIKTGIKNENITADTSMTVVKQKNFEQSDKRGVTISQVNNIAPNVLIAAQKIAQTILEFDEKATLLERREKMGGENS